MNRLAAIVRIPANLLSGLNVFGPIFGKELRVASRQRRNYFLRTLYIAVLTLIAMLVWYAGMEHFDSGSLYARATMSRVGMELLIAIGIFQFIALQVIAPVLTCTAISDEITHRTLDTLMMTRINSLQIVTGKLFSKLLTMILLVATALPLLAIIRVFGGIEWQLVVNLIALTLCAAMFSAAISLTFSIFHKQAYVPIIMTYVVLAAIYLLIPLLIGQVYDESGPGVERWFSYFNPLFSLGMLIERATFPMRSGYPGWSSPPLQCALLLAATVLLILFNSLLVRRVALRLAAGEPVVQFGGKRRRHKSTAASATRCTRAVSDRPVLWRELRTSFLTRRKRIIFVVAMFLFLGFTYACIGENLDDPDAQVSYSIVFTLVALVAAAVLPATTITTEKEASSLDALLVTPLTPGAILFGKAAGVLRRLVPVVILFFVHIIIFIVISVIHPLAILHTFLLLAGPFVFLTGTGIYFSLRVKRTTAAVMLNLGLALLIWALLPIFALLAGEAIGHNEDWMETTLLINPVMLDGISFDGTAHRSWSVRSLAHGPRHSPTLRFNWPWGGQMSADEFTFLLAVVSFLYAAVGITVLLWAAKRFRRLALA